MSTQHHRQTAVADGRPLRLSLGLRPLDLERWLEVDEHHQSEMAQKNRLLAERPHDVVAHLPAGLPGASETLALVRRWVLAHHPHRGADLPMPAGLHPIDEAGRLVQEDLCVLTRQHGEWVMTAASVCFPSRWRLADKIGASVAAIHNPVPGYHDSIGPIVDRRLDRLAPEHPVWRLNWTIVEGDDLFLPADRPPGRDGPVTMADLTVRVERQTLRRLPGCGDILFTIRTYRDRLPAVVGRPELAANLAATLRTCPPDLAEYKGWTRMLPSLLDQLDAVSRHARPEAPGQCEPPG